MPKYHFRVETTYRGPCIIIASSWPDLLDKIKLWTAQTMPGRMSVEFLQVEDIPEEGAPS